MLSIIVAFPNLDDANKIKSLLIRRGYDVAMTSNNASQVINAVNQLDAGIVLCGSRLKDMPYQDMYNSLPDTFSMILMASMDKLADCYNDNIVCVPMPLKMNELIKALETATKMYRRRRKKDKKPAVRSEKDKQIIAEAKELLMSNHGMTEEEAHRYIQKISMDSGNSMSETARMVLLLK